MNKDKTKTEKTETVKTDKNEIEKKKKMMIKKTILQMNPTKPKTLTNQTHNLPQLSQK